MCSCVRGCPYAATSIIAWRRRWGWGGVVLRGDQRSDESVRPRGVVVAEIMVVFCWVASKRDGLSRTPDDISRRGICGTCTRRGNLGGGSRVGALLYIKPEAEGSKSHSTRAIKSIRDQDMLHCLIAFTAKTMISGKEHVNVTYDQLTWDV
nr:hypothetical protein CFP56_79548 [Quercus suber]